MILISTSIIVLRLPTFLAQSIVINYKLMIHDSLEADNSQIKDASATSDIAARRPRSFECPLIAHWRSWLFVMPTSALRTFQPLSASCTLRQTTDIQCCDFLLLILVKTKMLQLKDNEEDRYY
ncbi:hypothetical protein AV940_14305 [Alteromonas sp. Mac2]|nr:hypothetical protein AV940_14305 [Alteromonas sp. Mac2]ANB21602.1 hypothetical protein A6K25_10125 [Alteromonas stellipolaris]